MGPSRSAGVPVLSARGVTASVPAEGGEARVLLGVDLDLRAGEVTDLAGPSGSGKTMLLRALARLLPSARGDLMLEGAPASAIAAERWRADVAMVPQLPITWPGTVAENLRAPWGLKVRSGATPPGDDALREALEAVGLADIERGRDASRLSVGQRARISLLRVTLTSPRVLLLDEPDANLDDAAAEAVTAYVARLAGRGAAVLRVRHLPRGERPDRRMRLADGRLTEEGSS